MKRFVVPTLIMLLVLALGVSAEEAAKKKMSFGITGGVSMGNWYGSDADFGTGASKKTRTGFAGGVFVNFALGSTFACQPQILYVQKGVKYVVIGSTMEVEIDYLELPVLFKWEPEMKGNMQPTIFAGPHLGLLLSAKAGGIDVTNQIKSTDFGVTFGAGIGTKMSSGELFLDVRFDLGMSRIGENSPEVDIKNTAFLVAVGYKFGH